MSVLSLSMSVVSLPRPYLPDLGPGHFCLIAWFSVYIPSVLHKYKTRYLNVLPLPNNDIGL